MESVNKPEFVANVKTVIVGAGPATLGLFCNAKKTNQLKQLCEGGIAILEKGSSFGGGNLQHYLINSNTSSDGFLQCLYGHQDKHKRRSRSNDKAEAKKDKKRNRTISPRGAKNENMMIDPIYQEKLKKDEKWQELYLTLRKPLDCFKSLHAERNPMFRMMKEYTSNVVPL